MTNRTQQSELMVTKPQDNYIRALIQERDLSSLNHTQIAWLGNYAAISFEVHEQVVRRSRASSIIDRLKELPKKPKQMTAREIINTEIPAGRYAVENALGELRFYQLWRPKDNPSFYKLYVLHGPDSSPVQRGAEGPILRKIGADPRAAAIRFGNEIGRCSNCGRRLTNLISRELGIGPVCGGRMFGDGFKDEVKSAREAIFARGQNPDEEME